MQNTETDKPVAIKMEVCGDTGERHMASLYQARDSDSNNIHQDIANDHISSCVYERCDTLESVHAVNQPYTCGSCSSRFTSICLLHEHIEVHGLGGSYHYNNRLRTAFPKYDSVCCMNHTDNSSLCAMGDSFQVGESTSYEISGNRQELASSSIDECTADNVEVKSNKATGGILSLQLVNSDSSEKSEKFVYNSETNNTSSVCVKTEKDNDSDVQNELYETGNSSANENFETRHEFQNNSIDECIAESTGVKRNEKMTCLKILKIRKRDGALIDKLPYEYRNRGANGRFKKKKLTKKKHYFKQTELCIGQNNESSSDKKTETSNDKKTEISSDKETEVISDRKSELIVKVKRYSGTSILPKGSPIVSELDSEFQNCTCFKCKLVFQSEAFLESHLEKHEGRLVCDCCSESFPSLTEFEKHVLLGEGKDIKAVDILYCSYCSMMFTEIKGLKAHICLSAEDSKLKRQTVRNGTGTANKKGKQIGVFQYISLHKDNLSKINSDETVKTGAKSQCEICNKEFENEYFLVMHKIVHTYCHKCSKCNLCFISQFDRDQHNTTCINLNEYWTCQICGKHFNSKKGLSGHTDIHKDTKDLQCNLCGAVFKTKRSLVIHETRCPALEKRERKNSCDQCGSKFYSSYYLKKHRSIVHSDVRTFICEICGAAFKSNGVLRKHRHTHREDKKRFKCDICGVGFTQPMSLKRHNKIHLKQCMEKCTYCGKTFRESWNLKAHTRQHTGEKPYKCDSCGQGFTHNVSRKAHMRKCRKTFN